MRAPKYGKNDDQPNAHKEQNNSETFSISADKVDETPSKQKGRRRLPFRLLGYFLYGMVIAVALLVIVWKIDTELLRDGHLRNEALVGRDANAIRTGQGIEAFVNANKDGILDAPITIKTNGKSTKTSLREVDLSIDSAASAKLASNYYEKLSSWEQLHAWIQNFGNTQSIPLQLVEGPEFAQRWFALPLDQTAPVEPNITFVDDVYKIVKGKNGFGISLSEAKETLASETTIKGSTISLGAQVLKPRFSQQAARDIATTAQSFVGSDITATLNSQTRTIPASTYRMWFNASPTTTELRLSFDSAKTMAGLKEIFNDVGTPPKNARFDVKNGVPRVIPGQTGQTCCAPKDIESFHKAVFENEGKVDLHLETAQPQVRTADLSKLGVKEEVGVFTTQHPPGQPRVHNIHLISDLIRGQVIKPGDTFSVNEFVGPRTTKKGFVVDHVIVNNKFDIAVGGGISQFATTTFNAAFFAGLEIPEYQSHSLYISRYPYGREATLSYPHPDLKIKNNTPYGVLIWPEYTDSSLTVRLYSTKYVVGEQTKQTVGKSGACTLVRTQRTRTWVRDGSKTKDEFRARYSPSEGKSCS